MLDTVTATLDRAPTTAASLAERDEFGQITGPPGLFASQVVPMALGERDELGRPLHAWTPDGDLL
jgi:hypothetical protein